MVRMVTAGPPHCFVVFLTAGFSSFRALSINEGETVLRDPLAGRGEEGAALKVRHRADAHPLDHGGTSLPTSQTGQADDQVIIA